jgi:hypothetical protein
MLYLLKGPMSGKSLGNQKLFTLTECVSASLCSGMRFNSDRTDLSFCKIFSAYKM